MILKWLPRHGKKWQPWKSYCLIAGQDLKRNAVSNVQDANDVTEFSVENDDVVDKIISFRQVITFTGKWRQCKSISWRKHNDLTTENNEELKQQLDIKRDIADTECASEEEEDSNKKQRMKGDIKKVLPLLRRVPVFGYKVAFQ